MSISSKPIFIFLLKKPGKKTRKVEVFEAGDCGRKPPRYNQRKATYRLRVDGKWFGGKGKGASVSTYTTWQIRDLLWRSFNFHEGALVRRTDSAEQ